MASIVIHKYLRILMCKEKLIPNKTSCLDRIIFTIIVCIVLLYYHTKKYVTVIFDWFSVCVTVFIFCRIKLCLLFRCDVDIYAFCYYDDDSFLSKILNSLFHHKYRKIDSILHVVLICSLCV